MRLSEIKWRETKFWFESPDLPLPNGTWFHIAQSKERKTYNVYVFNHHWPHDAWKILHKWTDLNVVEAQCILFEIFTQGGNDA